MLSREFENKVQQKMEELKLTPAEDVWMSVEAALPEKNKRRRWLVFIIFLFLIIASSLLLWRSTTTSENNIAKNDLPRNETNKNITAQKEIQPVETTKTAITNLSDSLYQSTKTTDIVNSSNTAIISTGKAKLNIKNAATVDQGENNNAVFTKNKKQNSSTASHSKTKIKTLLPVEDDKTLIAAEAEKETTTVSETLPKDSLSIALTNKENIEQEKKKDSSLIKKVDTSKQLVAKQTQKKKQGSKWNYGITAGAGLSNVKSGLFTNEPVFADILQGSSGTGSPAGPPGALKPSNPTASLAASIGFYIERDLSAKWRFTTGLHYTYQSNKILVGEAVDSAGLYSSNGYYRSGNSVNYKNKFQQLQLPLLFQFRPLKKLPLYAEAGPVVSYLIKSNALMYSRNSTYVTDKGFFNKWDFSFIAGAGVDIAKNKKLLFSLGYRFSYSMSSVTRSSYGKQHLMSSLLYVNIPLKK